jgi:hypothetical protein
MTLLAADARPRAPARNTPALIKWLWGVDAERKPLEAIASPLTFVK